MELVIKQFKSKKDPSKLVNIVYEVVKNPCDPNKKEWKQLGFANIVSK